MAANEPAAVQRLKTEVIKLTPAEASGDDVVEKSGAGLNVADVLDVPKIEDIGLCKILN